MTPDCDKTKGIINSLSANRDAIYYHYTNYQGLIGIISSSSIWLADINSLSLNDDLEIKYGVELTLSLNEKQACVFKEKREFEKSRLLFDAAYSLVNTYYRPQATLDIFTSSFCETNNDLAMWRYYAANGAGVVLGFNMSQFENNDHKHEKGDTFTSFNKVIYGSEAVNKIISCLIDIFIDSNDPNSIPVFLSKLFVLFPCFKRESYKHEKECRLITYSSPNIDKPLFPPEKLIFKSSCKLNPFKQSKRYLPFDFQKTSLERIYIGKHCNFQHAEREIRKMLNEHGYSNNISIEQIVFD